MWACAPAATGTWTGVATGSSPGGFSGAAAGTDASAARASCLQVVSGALLTGEMLAATTASLVAQINEGVTLSLSSTVDVLRH